MAQGPKNHGEYNHMQRSPVTKRQRRLGIHVFPKSDKYLQRRAYSPGMHGPSKRSRSVSEYGIQLREKQRAKFIYGLQERQFARFFEAAARLKGNTGANLIILLERRLDNILYRSGLAKTRLQARQWIGHGHITVNSVKVKIPSYIIKLGDAINVSSKGVQAAEKGDEIPKWLDVDHKTKSLKVAKLPDREDVVSELEEQLIVEFYSR